MIISILGSTGRVGSALVRMLLDAGHEVALLARALERVPVDVREHERARVVVGDARDGDALRDVLGRSEVAVSALGGTGLEAPGTMLSDSARALVAAARDAGVGRIIWVAASGILDVAGGGLRNQQKEYPAVFRLTTQEHMRVWDELAASGLAWTVVCPPRMPEGEPTGRYRVECDRLPEGAREITTGDVANFIAREVVEGAFVGARVGIGS